MSWPQYVANLRGRYRRRPVHLVVVTPSRRVAAWCRRGFELTHGVRFAPIVVGPDQIPKVLDPRVSERTPLLSLLSCIAHVDAPEFPRILEAFVKGRPGLDDPWLTTYAQPLFQLASRRFKELRMRTESIPFVADIVKEWMREGIVQGRAEGIVQGKAEGIVQGIVAVLEARGLSLSETDRARIAACRDLETLDRWLRRAAKVESIEELFEPE